ncbi:hypothetical protein bcgnr5380_24350 [Bacillus cereus]
MSLLRKNKEESRITIPFNIYTIATIKANVPAPNPALSNIEANAAVVKKIMGVSSKKTKPAKIRLLKLCPEREKAKKFRMLNIAITKRRIINSCMPADILAPPGYLVHILYSNAKEGTPLNNYNKRNK